MLDKRFNHNEEEPTIYNSWENEKYFSPEGCVEKGVTKEDAEPFSIVLPPPNVTGKLHMGHASMLVLEDIMVRYHRMKGDKTLWLPGFDHAAIATQTKVESKLIKETGKNRHDFGREKFLEEVDKYVEETHDTIESQTRAMGASLDWEREAFTLDKKREFAVRTAFKKMYEEGLIYRGNRIVNWCPSCGSTLSDDEVEHKERRAKFYQFKYSKEFPISIATTRPETKLGDQAVAVSPDDERYKQYIGKEYNVDFAGTKLHIKIVADEEADPEFGTGAVGITPAHSNTDWEIATRHNLPKVKIIDEEGKMTKEAGANFEGLYVKEARKKVIEWLEENNLLEKEEEVPQNLSVCYRCSRPVEPLPKLQWFIDVNKDFEMGSSKIDGIKEGDKTTLKELMKKVVENNQIEIIPDRFRKVYNHWIDNLRDWCISRQIWYGHRVPVWYKGDDIYVGTEEPKEEGWTQDSDTLDTWFSSGLWSFSTLGWPEETKELKEFHPTSVLETGYDILFFWVARMILMSTYHLGDIPFKTVYLHGLVRDKNGKKMSKSADNGIDPVEMIEKYGADATRLSLIIGVGPGSDINLSEEKIKAYRNFGTKIWNVARFLDMSKPENYNKEEAEKLLTNNDKKIISDLEKFKEEITNHYEKFEFNLAGEKSYDYLWNKLANIYLEGNKDRLKSEEKKEFLPAYYLLEKIFFETIKMLHPFMPFITEAVYQKLNLGEKMLIVEKW
jgi:valyl-tRNA synthetase